MKPKDVGHSQNGGRDSATALSLAPYLRNAPNLWIYTTLINSFNDIRWGLGNNVGCGEYYQDLSCVCGYRVKSQYELWYEPLVIRGPGEDALIVT